MGALRSVGCLWRFWRLYDVRRHLNPRPALRHGAIRDRDGCHSATSFRRLGLSQRARYLSRLYLLRAALRGWLLFQRRIPIPPRFISRMRFPWGLRLPLAASMTSLALPTLFLTPRTARTRTGRTYRPPERHVRAAGRDSLGIGINFLARLPSHQWAGIDNIHLNCRRVVGDFIFN